MAFASPGWQGAERMDGGAMRDVLPGDGAKHPGEAGIGVGLVDAPNEEAVQRDGRDRVGIARVRRIGNQPDRIPALDLVVVELRPQPQPSEVSHGGTNEGGGRHRCGAEEEMKRGQRGWRKIAGDQCGRGRKGAKWEDGRGGCQDREEVRSE